jgi:hypothetical protein
MIPSKLVLNSNALYNVFPAWELSVNDVNFDREILDQTHLWKDNSLVNQKNISYKSERKEYIPNTYIELDNWFKDFKENNNILDIISDHFEKDETTSGFFHREFPIEDKGISIREFLGRRCSYFYRIMKDEPGFKMNIHFDNRAVLGNIFFNLVDNPTSTEFFNTFTTFYKEVLDKETNLMYVAPKEKGKGVFFLNNPHMYHTIQNTSDTNRYVVNVVVFIPQLTNLNS